MTRGVLSKVVFIQWWYKMQIITNYYDQNGQIVKASAGMDSRDFYQNTLGTHAFNEMFRASNMDLGFGYKLTGSGIYLLSGGVPGLTKPSFVDRYLTPRHQTGPTTWYPEHWNPLDGKIASAFSLDGTLCTSIFGVRYIYLDIPSDKQLGLHSIKIQFTAVGGGASAALSAEIKNTASSVSFSKYSLQAQWCTNPEWTNGGGYSAGVTSTTEDSGWYAPSAYDWGNSFCRDNQWHTFSSTFNISDGINFSLDSELIKSSYMSEFAIYDGTQMFIFQATIEKNSYLLLKDISIEVM